jgi:hypothetical protein
MQSGLRWARVELDAAADVRGTWVLPTARAMPPLRVRAVVEPSVVSAHAEMEKHIGAIAPAKAGACDLDLVVTQQGSYVFILEARKRSVLVGPLQSASPHVVDEAGLAVWRLAYAKWLSTMELATDELQASVERDSVRATCVDGQGRRVALKASSGFFPKQRPRDLKFEVEPAQGAAFGIADDGAIREVLGGEQFLGNATGCVRGRPGSTVTMRVLAGTRPIDLRLAVAAAAGGDVTGVVAAPARTDEVPLGKLSEETRRALVQMDELVVTSASLAMPTANEIEHPIRSR